MLVITTLILAAAGSFNAALKATSRARDTEAAAMFLETTIENVLAQPYANLPTLNGNQIFDGTNAADSRFQIDIAVFEVEVNLLQVRAIVMDLESDRVIGRLSTQKSNR